MKGEEKNPKIRVERYLRASVLNDVVELEKRVKTVRAAIRREVDRVLQAGLVPKLIHHWMYEKAVEKESIAERIEHGENRVAAATLRMAATEIVPVQPWAELLIKRADELDQRNR